MTDNKIDPWGDASPWEADKPETPTPAPEVPMTAETPAAETVSASVSSDGHKVRVTLKGGAGYADPWITIDGTDVADALAQLKNSAVVKELLETTAKVGGYFAGLSGPSQPAGKPTFQGGKVQNAPAGPSRPANVPEGWQYKEGTNKAGKPYKAWFPPRGVDAAPIWL
ncbi:hypothetical protein [Streptomyces sp. NPDC002644]